MSSKHAARCMMAWLLILHMLVLGCARSPQQKYARSLDRGKELLQKQDFRRAALEFKNAAQVKPKEPEVYYQLGLAYLGAGETRSAARSFAKTLELNPKYTAAELKLAGLAVRTSYKEEWGEAEKRLIGMLESAPMDPEVLKTLAVAEWRLGRQDEAEEYLTQAVAKFPEDLKSAVGLAEMKAARKDMAGAEEVLKKVKANNPRSAEAAVAVGNFYLKSGRIADAEREFHQALQVDGRSGLGLVSLAGLQWRTGHTTEADELYRRAAALTDSQYKPVHAVFLYRSGKRDQAIAEFEKLAKQDPSDRGARSRLVAAYIGINKVPEAEKVLATALAKNPNDLDALLERTTLYLRAANYGEAEKDLQKILHLQPDSAVAHYLSAKVYEGKKATLNQRQELSEALRLNPVLLGVRIDLAKLLISTGSAKAALDVLAQTPASQKNSLTVVIYRNWALIAAGQRGEARKGVDQALAVSRSGDGLMQDATLRIQQKDYTGARRSLQESLKQNPDNFGALDLIVQSYILQQDAGKGRGEQSVVENPNFAPQSSAGRSLLANKDPGKVRAALNAAKAGNPGLSVWDLSLTQLDLNEGKLNDARQRLSALLNAKPDDLKALVLLENVEEMAGNSSAAIELCHKIIRADNRNAIALNNLAYGLLEHEKKPDEALKYAQMALEIAPNAAVVQDTMGWILFRKGLYKEAMPYFNSAVAKEPTALRKAHLALACMKTGDQDRARKMYQSALQMNPKLESGLLDEGAQDIPSR